MKCIRDYISNLSIHQYQIEFMSLCIFVIVIRQCRFRRAVESVSKDPMVSLSPPYCDAFGAGLIVTMSMALTSPRDPKNVIAVVAGDFTCQYMNDNFVQQLPQCEGKYRYDNILR